MNSSLHSLKRPLPVIGATDYATLMRLANAALSQDFVVVAELNEMLENTWVVANEQVSHDTVRMGSAVSADF